MASLNYLWYQRAVFSTGSYQFFKAWTKRLLLLPELLMRNRSRLRLVSKGAQIHASAEIGDVVINGKCSFLSVGKSSFLGCVKISLHDEVKIGSKVCINDGVEILTASHDVGDPHWKLIKGEVQIEDFAWIGTRAMILPGVRIGSGAVVGAGAVVSKSVAPGEIVVGNPARPISKTRCQELNYNPCEFLAANRAWLIG